VTEYIYPAILVPPMANLVADQFVFRPTGSTTAALIDLLNNITELLQHNEYAYCSQSTSLELSTA